MEIRSRLHGWFASDACRPYLALTALLLFHLTANLWWLSADNHAVETDEEGHMITAREYYSALFPFEGPQDLKTRFQAVAAIEPGNPAHPPLLHILGAFMIRIFGYSPDVIAFTMTLCFLLTLAGCFRIARLYLDARQSFFCTFCISFTPMMYTASRYFMTDYLSMTIVVWAMYALLRSRNYRLLRWNILFGGLTGLGILARPTTFIYYLLPACMAGGAALLQAFMDAENRSHRLYLAIRNGLVVLLVSMAVFGPWYGWHHEKFFGFWLTTHEGGPLALLRYEKQSMENSIPPPAKSAESNSQKENSATPLVLPEKSKDSSWNISLSPYIPWLRYPVLIINNGMFLIAFLMVPVGMVLACIHPRFRKARPVHHLFFWAAGAYVFMTLGMRFANARYALQFLPPLLLFSTMPLLLISGTRRRRMAQWACMALLLFQYGNLTFHDYGALGSFKIPILLDPAMQREYDDHGLYLFKPRLAFSIAYSNICAPTKENFKDRIFDAMTRNELEHSYTGLEAPYIRLNIRGLLLEEQHYWPDSAKWKNPFRRTDLPAEEMPRRRFRHYGFGKKIEEVIDAMDISQYILYTTEGITGDTEQEWRRIFEEHGFEELIRFHQERYGRVPARYIGVYARPPAWQPLAIRSDADIAALDLYTLYRLKRSGQFPELSPNHKALVESRLKELFLALGPPTPLNESVSYVSYFATHHEKNQFYMHLVFQAHSYIDRDLMILLRGHIPSEYLRQFPESIRARGFIDWLFEPIPDERFWSNNNFVIVRHLLTPPPIPMKFHIGLYDRKEGVWGSVAETGTVDFSKIPRQKETPPPTP